MDEKINTPKDWRLLAEDDLSVAEYHVANIRPIPTHHSTFNCQQAAIKILKVRWQFLGKNHLIHMI